MKNYHKNPRQIKDKQFRDLRAWLLELGDLSGIVHDLVSDEVISGNQRMRAIDIAKCEIVLTEGPHDPDAQGTVAHGYVLWQGAKYNYRQVRWTPEQCEKANIVANKAGGSWDFDVLANEFDIVNLLEWGFTAGEFGFGPEADDEATEQELSRWDVPDAIFATDNDLGIPLLDANMQAQTVTAPVLALGAKVSRKQQNAGLWHFYTEDYRFEALWVDPTPVVNSGCQSVVEPNYSAYTEMPRIVALWSIYRKRWLARWWQQQGIRVFVDLYVAEAHYADNLLGVPHGWRSWATRGYVDRLENTVLEYDMACSHAGTSDILFFVYGGGKAVKELCTQRGWVHVIEQRDAAKVKAQDG